MHNNKGKGCDNSAHLFLDSYFFSLPDYCFYLFIYLFIYFFVCFTFRFKSRNKHAVLLIGFVPSGIVISFSQ